MINKRVIRLFERGIPVPKIAEAMGKSEKAIGGVLGNYENLQRRKAAGEIAKLVTVKDPEKYMRRRGVWYGPHNPLAQSR